MRPGLDWTGDKCAEVLIWLSRAPITCADTVGFIAFPRLLHLLFTTGEYVNLPSCP